MKAKHFWKATVLILLSVGFGLAAYTIQNCTKRRYGAGEPALCPPAPEAGV